MFEIQFCMHSFVSLALTNEINVFPHLLEWQSLPERGFLLDHTLPHRLPLQTAKGMKDINVHKHKETNANKLGT